MAFGQRNHKYREDLFKTALYLEKLFQGLPWTGKAITVSRNNKCKVELKRLHRKKSRTVEPAAFVVIGL